MPKKTTSIPIETFSDIYQSGIFVGKITAENIQAFQELDVAHRHDKHFFMFGIKGQATIEIDFETHIIDAPAIMYIHPSQIHRATNTTIEESFVIGLTDENINSNYLKILEQNILPAKALTLSKNITSIFSQTIALCLTIFEQNPNSVLMKDYANAFVGLVVSQYLEINNSSTNNSRYFAITQQFKLLIERDFSIIKRPTEYAHLLNISTNYLNECVKNATGFSPTHLIQQRIMLEAKRLLYHTDKSSKEIAFELGYEDNAYFSRLFTKTTGTSALVFRNKNRN